MRADARSLLDRLGRSDFAYKEFADRFSDLELWPLFEALLKDPRLFKQELVATVAPSEPVATPGIAAKRPAEPEVLPVRTHAAPAFGGDTLADHFNRYEVPATPAAPSPTADAQDVRAALRRLSGREARGET